MNQQQQGPECPICLEQLENGTAQLKTGCGHAFHLTCIQLTMAAAAQPTCPLCRGGLAEVQRVFKAKNSAPASLSAPPAAAAPLRLSPRNNIIGTPPPFAGQPPQQLAPAFPQQQLPQRLSPRMQSYGRHGSIPDVPPADAVDLGANKRAAAQPTAHVALEVATSLERVELAADESSEVFGMISVKAPQVEAAKSAPNAAASASGDAAASPPLDICVVIDKSGSMGGEKIALLKKTLEFVVSVLKDHDRLSIVEFDSGVSVLTPLWRVTEERKRQFQNKITGISASGGTDIALGLRTGLKVLSERTDRNAISSVLLLTDGQDSASLRQLDTIMHECPKGTSIHTFGFGADHDARVMSGIAERASGTFTYIAALQDVALAFAVTLGGLSSIVATEIEVRVLVSGEHMSLRKLHTKFEHRLADDARSAVVKIADLFGGETRDVVFSMIVPKGTEDQTVEAIAGSVAYCVPGSDVVNHVKAAPLLLARPRAATLPLNVAVNAQRNRVRATDALLQASQLAEKQDFKAARECLTAAVDEITASVSAQERLCQSLLTDLNSALSRMVDARSYGTDGYAVVQQSATTHANQRQTVSAAARSNSSSNNAYGYNAVQSAYLDAI